MVADWPNVMGAMRITSAMCALLAFSSLSFWAAELFGK